MILTLHDELQFEVRESAVAEFAAELPDLMCTLGLERFGFKLPLAVEVNPTEAVVAPGAEGCASK